MVNITKKTPRLRNERLNLHDRVQSQCLVDHRSKEFHFPDILKRGPPACPDLLNDFIAKASEDGRMGAEEVQNHGKRRSSL